MIDFDQTDMPNNFPTGGIRLAKLVCALMDRVEELERDIALMSAPPAKPETLGLKKQ